MNGKKHQCSDCKHLRRETESWELPHIAWWVCDARPSMGNLRSFPFKATNCVEFKKQGEQP